MKSLEHIQKLSKMGLILSRIKFIFCFIGIVGCLIGLISIPFGSGSSIKIGNIVLHGLMDTQAGFNLKSIGTTLVAWLVICIDGAITAWFAQSYFSKELMDGTPFTRRGAFELKRLGILVIVVSLGTSMLAKNENSVILGILFIVVSLLCNYGAEQFEKEKEEHLPYGYDIMDKKD